MAASIQRNLETILVVDDTAFVVNVVASILEAANFIVLCARSGLDALNLATNYAGTIDLLLSDADMPGMSGPEIGEFLKKARPEMRLVFMSRFPGGSPPVLNYEWSYIQRPLVPDKLLEMIESV